MRVVDLFSGVGGMSLGFERAGHKVVLAADNWKAAATVYSDNFDHPIALWDLSEPYKYIDAIKKHSPDMIIGGPPCQDFSHAGKRTEGDRADLTFQFATLVGAIQPQWFVMENVQRTLKSEAYQKARSIFKESGYGLTEVVLNAANCGVPQRRKRFFSIGLKNESDGFLLPTIEENISDEEMTVKAYFGKQLGVDNYYRHPRNYSRRAVYSIDEPSATIRGVNRPIPDGYPGHKGDTASLTSLVRPLTTIERAMVQTFPEDFVWSGSKTNREQMIGNAVPVNLAKFVGACINSYDVNRKGDVDGFKVWLISKGYSGRYLKDILSRLKRAMTITETLDPMDISLTEISDHLAKAGKSNVVISHVKKSVKLYRDFKSETCPTTMDIPNQT